MNKKELIDELIGELCLLHSDGLPHLNSAESRSYISEFFNKRGMYSEGNTVIQNLLEDDKDFKNPALNKVVTYKDVNGEDAEGKVGNLLRRPKEEDAHQKAVAALGGEGSDNYKKAMNDLGGEGQPNRDVEKEKEKKGEGEPKGQEPQTAAAFDPKTKGGSDYLKGLPDTDPAKPDSMKDDSETSQTKKVAKELEGRKTEDGEELDIETTENGSLIIGVEHGEGTQSTKETIEKIKSLPKGTKVMFVGEGGMSRDDDGNIELAGEQAELRDAVKGHFDDAEESSWDENANVFDGDSPVFDEIAKSLGGSKSKANASVWSNMVGQGDDMDADDYLDDEGKEWLIDQARKGGSKNFDGEVDWNNLSDEQREDLYQLNFRDDDSYGETEIFQGQEAYNNFRQQELDRKIKEAEANGYTVIAPVGNSHVDMWRGRNKNKKNENFDAASKELTEGILLEASFSPAELSKVKYQPQWIDYIKNGKPFQLEPYGEIIIDKSFLKSTGYGDVPLEQVLSGGTKNDIDAFFKDGSSFGAIIPSTDGKKYKLTDISKSTFTGQGGGEIPTDAAYYEMGICVEYNKIKGMNTIDAMKAASVDPKKYQKYEGHLTEVCSNIAKNLPNIGTALRQTGGDSYTPSSVWPSSDGTPKTDIYGGSSHRVSVKKAGGSQLASGKKGDAVGLFMGGLAFYETHSSTNSSKYLLDVISKIENEFKSFNTDNEVGSIRDTASKSYIQWRVPQIKKQTSEKDDKIEKHARAEAIAVGIGAGSGTWKNWFLDGVDVLGERDVMKWFDEYWKSQGTKELQDEVREIVNAAINHKKIDAELKKAFNDNEFKKWVVYEASSGNFKFSGNPDLNTVNDAIANKILVFDLNGKVKISDINESWASQYASSVFPVVSFKSSGRQKYTALRLMQESKDFGISDFQNDLVNIMNEEMNYVNNMITESVELFDELITEINFSDVMSKIKKFAQNLMKRILDSIKSFYNNTIKKVITKLKEYIKLGINKFLEYIGIEIDGSVSLKINF